MEQDAFPLPDALSPAMDSWVRVFTEVDSASGFVHDSHKLDVVYETLYLNPDAPPRSQNRASKQALGEYRVALLALASGKRDRLSVSETRARRAWGHQASAEALKAAAERLRFQRGQSDRTRKGLTRYARWNGKIGATLRKQGLPEELAALPLVESSYNPRAVSKAGAVGLWQFMPATARRYLRVDVLVEGLGIDKNRLRSINPALHHAVWNGERFVPEGYMLNLPATFVAS
jgi:membrane-bound lytic murein transglycosylase D